MTTPPSGAVLLSLDGITHTFGRVRALDGASLQVRAGSVHALLGENGAGKTTLMRVVFGLLRAQQGVMQWRGAPMTMRSPSDALAHGIGMVHQHFTLVPTMTVAENVALGGHGGFDPKRAAARVREVAARAGLALDPDARVQDLPVGAQQRCEIVKALARDVTLLILDEPTAVLAPAEAAELLRWMRAYADAGNAVVLITHKLRDALAVADDITVLHRGRTVLSTPARDTDQARVANAMLGGATVRTASVLTGSEAPDAMSNRADTGAATENADAMPPVLALNAVAVRDANGVDRVRSATLQVRAGEIVGIGAVEGAGQHELLRVLAGRLSPTSGTRVIPKSVGFVPEDRHRDALLLDAPLFENTALQGAGARRGVIDWNGFRTRTTALLQRFDVRASGADAVTRTLSGGNQQKLVLGRELEAAREALVVENPSRGLDFVATDAVHQALRAARDAGMAVVVYSSDLDEVVQLADRVFAMHNGTLIESARNRDALGRTMLSGADGITVGAGTDANAGTHAGSNA
ncbi:ABC transporter ATP-binding protein [Gemmatimonas groenlandica]|uniref:ATP-binding cassette domain-containing protein n=1 Tax=Gemmatimonas groenlandica TaxID=2732249 RepID=A0A6M4ITJ3_9BACT|nr:ATP-binding cassette domain-containing protein [Gemmatimonas groenlandica]QJR36837.1 ATP-binding cassette domain-containing protein [Gemmatimonas groenlandica]